MNANLIALRQAAIIYPILAALFTLPYIAYNYRKYGSVRSLRIVIVYSFALYLLCVYCLVILPLPTGEAARALSGRKMQLTPFKFLQNMVKESDVVANQPRTWPSLILNSAFLTTALNVCMTIPFGLYLRYYFRCGWKKTLALSFLLSLFFELTQLSGLYFIYPGSYRLFDVDDLMTNTLGGMLGYWLAKPLTRWLPSREALDQESVERSREVSLLRRMLAAGYDLTVGTVLSGALAMILPFRFSAWGILIYLCVCPMLMDGQTLGMKWTRLRLETDDGGAPQWFQYVVRAAMLALVFVVLPVQLNRAMLLLTNLAPMTSVILFLIVDGGYVFCLLFELIRMAMRKPLFYEKLSRTRVVNTLQPFDEGTDG